jgi:hypothetical protein
MAEADASVPQAAPRPRPARARPPRRFLIIGLVALLVLAAVPATLLLRSRSQQLSATSAQDQLVPFSFKHPGGWQRQESGVNVVFSPHAGELLPLFSQKGTGGTWEPVNGLLKRDAKGTVGLATSFTSTQVVASDADQLRDALQPLLPASASFSGAAGQLLVGGHAADQLEGELADPASPGSRLHFSAVVVQVQRPEPKTVYLIFFAPTAGFEGNRPLFQRILRSVDFIN